MNAVIIFAGIYLSSRIIRYISGELTEAERQKQLELESQTEQILSQNNDTTPQNNEVESTQSSSRVSEKKRDFCNYLRAEAKTRAAEFASLHEEIKKSKREVISALRSKNVVHTPLRKHSLELLFRQLCEAQEKCFRYKEYLELYCEGIALKDDSDAPCIFQMQLPAEYPYIGELIWVNVSQLEGNRIRYNIPGLFSISVRIMDMDTDHIPAQSVFPIMITDGRRKEYYASIEKGAFKAYELSNTHLGLSATVSKIQKSYLLLTYQNQLELFLPRENLIKPDRFPPVRSSLTVYPVTWEYNLQPISFEHGKTIYPVTVSERKEDAGSSLEFTTFPICFTEDDLSVFMDYYVNNDLQNYDEEFLIGPVHEEDCTLRKGSLLKLQFGDIPLFYIKIDEHEDRSDVLRYYFRFHSMCGPEEKTFTADDIFLPFNVSFSPYYAGTSTEMIQQYMDIDDINDVTALIWDLFEEFRIQCSIKKNRKGMGYFFKWENITSQLISVLEQGDSISIPVSWEKGENSNSVYAKVADHNILEQFIVSFAHKADAAITVEWKPQFFVKDELENRYATAVLDAGQRLRIVGKNASEVFFNSSSSIELFASNRPYAEYQQKNALRQFRIGQVANPAIQAACLDGANIVSRRDSERELVPFHNAVLATNLSQRTAVEKAFKEKNIFLIQGPPGTGKTTVIRELVEQVFDADNSSRILIVSQANVAVDNALSGLIEKYGAQTVRCGNGNKIAEAFQKLRLQSRCQEYIDNLQRRKSEYSENIFNEWNNLVTTNEAFDYSPVLCELIIRNHRLIGATCVGLSKRNIGLERTEFDLVIIDEAGKALPAELLIPLIRAKKAVIIGDQNQLPPVINPILYDEERIDLEERMISENDLFCHSFFERLYNFAPEDCKVMLDTQYRMPAVIGTAISQLFYGGKLKNGVGTEKRLPVLFDSNLTFINFDSVQEYHEYKNNSDQITNPVEGNAAVAIIKRIRKKDPLCSVAVITPYKGQKRMISNAIVKNGIHYQVDNIQVDTVDSFQGSEADVVVFCSTRSVRPTRFFRDSKRLNVALSRAKRELIILGKMSYLYKYREGESKLPSLARYIKSNGNVITPEQCGIAHESITNTSKELLLLSLNEISLPSDYYMKEESQDLFQEKINEYYKNGDFLNPLPVKRLKTGYILVNLYEQYRAAQDLNISECYCVLVP